MEVSFVPLPRSAQVVAVSVALLATTMTTGTVAAGEPDGQGQPECAVHHAALRYLIVFGLGTARQAAAAESTAACGELVVYYPEIAVAVATSYDRRFADRIGRTRAFSAQQALREERGPRMPRRASKGVTADPVAVPAEDRTAEQWGMSLIHADQAHRFDGGSRNVVVGVLDSGIDPAHPDLRAALDPALSAGCLTGKADPTQRAWQPTTSAHGTHVAGTIAAAADGRGITGVAPGVRIASVKVVDDEGFILPEYAVCGLMWASANRMTVTNNSYSVDPWLRTCDRDGEHVVYEAVRRAVEHSTRSGVLTVAAATNESIDLTNPRSAPERDSARGTRRLDSRCQVLPAGLRGVVAVSAIGPDRLKASYSAYGLGLVDVTAPGGEMARGTRNRTDQCVLSAVPGGYARYCGTSMATPHASGVVALLASRHPGATPQRLARLLADQAEPIPCPADYDLTGTGVQDAYCSGYAPYNSFHGHGMVDALAAVTS
jgi:subtilisin family serine protease